MLKAPQGLLGGIGRRVSTLIWGGAAATGGAGGGIGEAKLVQGGDSIENKFGLSSGLKNGLRFLIDSET